MKLRHIFFGFLFACVFNILSSYLVYAQDLSQKEYVHIAKNLESVGDFKSAEQKYFEGIKKYDSPLLWVELAKFYYQRGDYDNVLKITNGKIMKDFYHSVNEIEFIHNDSLHKTGAKYSKTIPFIAVNNPSSQNDFLANEEKQEYTNEAAQLYSILCDNLLKIRDNLGLSPEQIILKIGNIASVLSKLNEIMADTDMAIASDVSKRLDMFSAIAKLENDKSEELIGEDSINSGKSSIRSLACNALIIKHLTEIYLKGNNIKFDAVATPDGICLDNEYIYDQLSDNNKSTQK